ncbi:putative GTPase activating protein for Arf-domain-containing protein [Phellopilus nigrolimitatus]|nr:putative GTPase activating protein for Arf-domain-containing protein [Phellopilus nigrolimitatus]
MYRQDKATTERHTKMLRELVKRPGNKMCADCKRNDARWASWNIGVFVCIRCSGVHRSMGTHISKVKSVDLDTWTPEQMESIQRWGNHRANLYWEAHLRPGHNPPEHKVDSFIRSKYESRRWAREGPPPSDPATLESEMSEQAAAPKPLESPAPATVVALASPEISTPPRTTRQPQPHQLLSASTVGRASPAQPVQVTEQPSAPEPIKPAVAPTPQNDLFSLDFHAPTSPPPQTQAVPKKDVKNDILSLFSTSAAAAAPTAAVAPQSSGGFGQFATADPFAQWGQPQPQPPAQPQVTSMMGGSGTAMWGAQSGWSDPAVQSPPAQPNVWGGFQNAASTPAAAPVQSSTQGLFETQNIWGSGVNGAGVPANGGSTDLFGSLTSSTTAPVSSTQKKDDAFGDLWGNFK